MKIGIDIHGVINENPAFFNKFMQSILDAGGEVHILSGPPSEQIWQELKEMGFNSHAGVRVFSIVDFHKAAGTAMKQDSDGQWWTVKKEDDEWVPDQYVWDKTKGDYCLKHGIDLMIDDSDAYAHFFKTPYARFYSKNKRKHFVQKGSIK